MERSKQSLGAARDCDSDKQPDSVSFLHPIIYDTLTTFYTYGER